MAQVPRRRRWFKRAATFTVFLALGGGIGASVALWPRWRAEHDRAHAMVLAHWDHQTSHPGWSFPAHVWSAPAEIDGMSPQRRALHAAARGYVQACPPMEAGEYCAKTGDVSLRGGRFPEGRQPAGADGWTRPLAFEPVRLGVLVGPDGEIREHLPIERAPQHLIDAILAAEDAEFYAHGGVDFPGLLRAAFANAQGGAYKQGASTLTMQLVRNLSQEKDKSITRKLREITASFAAEEALGKERILQMYLDAPYLGQAGNLSVCGFQAASQYYWGLDAADLSLAQAATLAAILPAPGRFAPDRDPDAAKERRDRVLVRMGQKGYDVAEAIGSPVIAEPHPILPDARFPTYLQATRLALEAQFPPEVTYGAGLQVFTAVDVVAQSETERLMDERVTFLERTIGRRGPGPLIAAVALVEPSTGRLVAAYDSAHADATDFSRVTQARRQAGSSFKPVVYALAFSPGPDGAPMHRADDTVPNSHRVFPGTNGWAPRNISGRYSPTATYAYGLAASMNIATAAVLEQSGGPEAIIRLGAKIGFDTSKFPKEMGLSLGQGEVTPLEMARFVGTVVGGGKKLPASPLVAVLDADGTSLFQDAPPSEQALTPEAALLTRELMSLVVHYGTGGSVRGGGGFPGYEGDIVGKTGTADDEKDLWFVGGTPTYAGALWLGYDHPTRIGGSASDLAAPTFGWWMRAVHDGLPRVKFDDAGFTRAYVCSQTGLAPTPTCGVIPAPLLPGQGVRGVCAGTHPPETGVSMSDHISLWEKLALQRAAREQGIPLAEDGLPVSFPLGADGVPMEFVRPPPKGAPPGTVAAPVLPGGGEPSEVMAPP